MAARSSVRCLARALVPAVGKLSSDEGDGEEGAAIVVERVVCGYG